MAQTRTSLQDLNEYLFGELDALSNTDLTGEDLESEIHRAKAMAGVAEKIISNGKLILDAVRVQSECSSPIVPGGGPIAPLLGEGHADA